MKELTAEQRDELFNWINGMNIQKRLTPANLYDFLTAHTEPEDEGSEHYLDNFMCAFCNHFQIDASDFDMTAFLKDWLQQEDK